QTPNGCTSPCIEPRNGLKQWAQAKDAQNSGMGLKILKYMGQCALPAGQTFKIRYYDGVTYTFTGVAGLGPSWTNSSSMNTTDSRRVSACMQARINGAGNTVNLLLQGTQNSSLWSLAQSEWNSYPYRESFFWTNGDGGLFASNTKNAQVSNGGGDTGNVCNSR